MQALNANVSFKEKDIIKCCLNPALGEGYKVDIIVSNPPYIVPSESAAMSETVLNVISFAVIMVAVVLVLFVLSKILTGVTKLVMLGWLDRLLGLVFALLKAGLLIGIAIILFDTLNVKFEFVEEKVLDESVLYAPIRDIAYVIFPYLKELLLKQ